MVAPIHYATLALKEEDAAEDDDALSTDLADEVLSPRQRAHLKGSYFGKRLKALEELGDIERTERYFIQAAHEYRNELYHVGISSNSILRAVAGQYFLLCCELFERLDAGVFSMTVSSEDRYTQVAMKYLDVSDGRVDLSSADKASLAARLRAKLPSDLPDLASTLSSHAQEVLRRIIDEFDFLIRENPNSLSAKEVLSLVQWRFDLSKAIEGEELFGLWIDQHYRDEVARIASELETDWTQRYRATPFHAWEERAMSLATEADPLGALHSYETLKKDMAYLEGAIGSASDELDQMIQAEIDRLRGK